MTRLGRIFGVEDGVNPMDLLGSIRRRREMIRLSKVQLAKEDADLDAAERVYMRLNQMDDPYVWIDPFEVRA